MAMAMATDPQVSFGHYNSGAQVGINCGTINFHKYDEIAELPFARGAEFDSYTNQHEARCLPGTRTELLNEIAKWAVSLQEGKCIFWLNGMAGTGKSTIARTVAERLKDNGALAASFFFKRGKGDRGNATKFVPTIVRQLAKSIPGLNAGVRRAIQSNPDIGTKGLIDQFEEVLLQPFLDLESCTHPLNMVIVIDALDECDVDRDIRLILQLLPRVQESGVIRLRVFLTSRPELPIRVGFKKLANRDHKDFILHEIPKKVIRNDISLFLDHRISEIRDEREPPLSEDWPGATNLNKLVELSIPLFIFAATICRIFEDPNWDPIDSLPEILAHQNDLSKLDGAYLPVLDRLLREQTEDQKKVLVHDFHQVIGAIVLLESSLSIPSLSKLIDCSERLIHTRLTPLHSVINVPKDETSTIRPFHLSFRDFLLDTKTREKTPFWLDEKKLHGNLATRCLIVCQSLKKNMCGLDDGTARSEVSPETIHQYCPPELQYSCRYWTHHLVQCPELELNSMMHEALLFLKSHFLHWLEAMILLGFASEVLLDLNRLQAALPNDKPSTISDFLYDAKRFFLRNHQIADEVPLQLYCAGLIFAPLTSKVRMEFEKEQPDWILQPPKKDKKWSAELQILEGHSDLVNSVAFSPSGQLLASSSMDCTVKLWEPETGALKQTLRGHENAVLSVAFSPDGHLLASGSGDGSVRLCEVETGTLQKTFESDLKSGSFHFVTFSPNGRWLAACDYGKILIWNTTAGSLQRVFEYRSRFGSDAHAVGFSPDSQLLVSGNGDEIRLWSTATGNLEKSLVPGAESVIFSPNGQLLAAGSDDSLVRLWDPDTGTLIRTLEGHSSNVKTVAFSPDGHLLVSGSDDGTLRLWDALAGTSLFSLEDHSQGITSLAFSPGGKLIASSSFGRTIQLWDISEDASYQPRPGHPRSVTCVALSPDGRLLLSVWLDGTIQLSDTSTGNLLLRMMGSFSSIPIAAFSPDGRLFAIRPHGSENTVQLWDTTTGSLQYILEGHSRYVYSIDFSPDGRLLASSSGGGGSTLKLQVWDTKSGILQQTLTPTGDPFSVTSAAFSNDNLLIASASYPCDNGVEVWDISTGSLQKTLNLRSPSKVINHIEFSEDGLSLRTEKGFLLIQSKDAVPAPPSPQSSRGILVEDSQWMILNGKRVLWLPLGYRPKCLAIQNGMVALGHESGRVTLMRFRV